MPLPVINWRGYSLRCVLTARVPCTRAGMRTWLQYCVESIPLFHRVAAPIVAEPCPPRRCARIGKGDDSGSLVTVDYAVRLTDVHDPVVPPKPAGPAANVLRLPKLEI